VDTSIAEVARSVSTNPEGQFWIRVSPPRYARFRIHPGDNHAQSQAPVIKINTVFLWFFSIYFEKVVFWGTRGEDAKKRSTHNAMSKRTTDDAPKLSDGTIAHASETSKGPFVNPTGQTDYFDTGRG